MLRPITDIVEPNALNQSEPTTSQLIGIKVLKLGDNLFHIGRRRMNSSDLIQGHKIAVRTQKWWPAAMKSTFRKLLPCRYWHSQASHSLGKQVLPQSKPIWLLRAHNEHHAQVTLSDRNLAVTFAIHEWLVEPNRVSVAE